MEYLKQEDVDNIIYVLGGASLGDSIYILPIFNNPLLLGKIVVMNQIYIDIYGDKVDNAIPFIFNKKAIVKFADPQFNTIDQWDNSMHKTMQIMRAFGMLGDYSCLPNISLTDNKEVVDKVTNIINSISNPIIFHPHHRSWGQVAKEPRAFSEEQMKFCMKKLLEYGYTPIGFPISSNATHYFPNIGLHVIPDFSIEELSLAYSLVGKYFGTQSGALDLMVATGGKSVVITSDDMMSEVKYNWDNVFKYEGAPSRTKTLTFDQLNYGLELVKNFDF